MGVAAKKYALSNTHADLNTANIAIPTAVGLIGASSEEAYCRLQNQRKPQRLYPY
jgi:hypothetical protein